MKQIFALLLLIWIHLPMVANDESQLLLNVASACESRSREVSDLALLRVGAAKFNLPELAKFADMLEDKVLDVQNRQFIAATSALLSYAERHYGKESYEAVTCRRYVISSLSYVDWDKAHNLAVDNTRYAAEMTKKNADDKSCNLLELTVQLEQIMIEKWHDEDNPTHWEQLFRIEKALEPYFNDEIEYTEELVDACNYMALLQTYQTSYTNYVDWMMRQFFPDQFYLEGRIYGNDLFLTLEQFILRAFEGSQLLWGEKDIRTLSIEVNLLTIQMRFGLADPSIIHNRFREIHSYLQVYLPEDDVSTDSIKLLIWECDINLGKKPEDIADSFQMLERCRNQYGDNNETYLNTAAQLATILMMVDTNQGSLFLDEAEKTINKMCRPKTDLYDSCMLYMIVSRQALTSENPEEFQDYFSRCIDYYKENHRPSWESVYMGKMLANILASSLLLYDNAVELMQIAIGDMEKLSGKDSFPLALSLIELADNLGQSQDNTQIQHAIDHAKTAINIFNSMHVAYPYAYCSLSDLQFKSGLQDEAAQSLRMGIDICTEAKYGMWRCYIQLLLGSNLFFSLGGKEEAEALFDEAIPFFNSHIEETGGVYMEGYYLISDYYRFTHQFEKAKDMLVRGIAHYDAMYGEYDGVYLRLISDLYHLYAWDLNDFDKAEQVLEGRLEAISRNPSFSLHNVVLQLLWNRYDLLSIKTGDWILRLTTWNEIVAQIQKMKLMAGDSNLSEETLLPLLFEYANICPTLGQLFSEGKHDIDLSTEEIPPAMVESFYQTIDMFENQAKQLILPLLEERMEAAKKEKDYLNNQMTLDLYVALANISLSIEQDTIKAENYYKELLNSDIYRYRAVSELANLKAAQRKYEEAIPLYLEMKDLAATVPVAMVSLQQKANYYASLVNAYIGCGMYHEAIDPAREWFSFRQQLAYRNLYLLTQAEREYFLQNDGVGGDGIWYLLPKFPEELAKDSYDAILATKGLMLRTSDNIKKAIIRSGNRELMEEFEELNRLNSQYKTMNMMTNTAEGDYNFDTRTIKMRQDIDALERSINRQVAQVAEGTMAPNWIKLQGVLKPGEVSVEYVFSDSTSCGALVLLPQGNPVYIPLASSKELWNDIDRLKMMDTRHKAEVLYQEDRLHLYDRLWQPMEDYLKDAKIVYYSPTGFLNDLAFAAFKCTDGSYLADHYELHQMLSTSDLVEFREKEDKGPVRTAALYGDIFYSPEHESLSATISHDPEAKTATKKHRMAIQDEGEAFAYLAFTGEEIDKVRNTLQNHNVVTTCLKGFVPTEETLRNINNNSPHILHLSTHGFFVQNDPDNQFLKRFPSTRFSSMQRSGLALVNANSTWEGFTDYPEDKDGIITANEVAQLDLSNTRLAVLSACQTAVGEYSMEGVYGMHRGFKQAGVKSIMATLWNVDDESTPRFMELFYQRWLSGTPMQQSLHEAVMELRKEYPSPYFWAPFVLMDAES